MDEIAERVVAVSEICVPVHYDMYPIDWNTGSLDYDTRPHPDRGGFAITLTLHISRCSSLFERPNLPKKTGGDDSEVVCSFVKARTNMGPGGQ